MPLDTTHPEISFGPTASSQNFGAVRPAQWPDFMVGQSCKPVRVLLVDDDVHFCSVVQRELMSDARVLLVGQAHSVRDAKRLIRQEAFDVLLLDLNLEDGYGLELIGYQRAARPSAEAIVISVMEGDEQLLRAVEKGAAGYLVKHCWFGNYVQATLQVANGGACITPHLARRLIQRLAHTDSKKEAADCEELTIREREILDHVASGYTNHEIAQRLAITVLTVSTHIRNIYRKLHVKNRVEALHAALVRGLL